MSGEVRILQDRGGVLSDIVDSLHDVTTQLRGVPHALVGGVAVLVHVPGHRVTEDIDSAKRGPGRCADSQHETAPRRHLHAREAKAHAVRWAIETAELITVGTDPASNRGPVTLPVARPSALVAMKTVAIADPKRGGKSAKPTSSTCGGCCRMTPPLGRGGRSGTDLI